MLLETLDTGAVWSVARGLARKVEDYKKHLADCDSLRRNDLDASGKRAASRTAVLIFSLVLFYGWSGLRDASGKQVRLDRDFLLRQQVDLCVESLKSGKGDLDPMLPGADEHPMSRAAEFTDGSSESIVHKNSCSLRRDL